MDIIEQKTSNEISLISAREVDVHYFGMAPGPWAVKVHYMVITATNASEVIRSECKNRQCDAYMICDEGKQMVEGK